MKFTLKNLLVINSEGELSLNMDDHSIYGVSALHEIDKHMPGIAMMRLAKVDFEDKSLCGLPNGWELTIAYDLLGCIMMNMVNHATESSANIAICFDRREALDQNRGLHYKIRGQYFTEAKFEKHLTEAEIKEIFQYVLDHPEELIPEGYVVPDKECEKFTHHRITGILNSKHAASFMQYAAQQEAKQKAN